MMGDVMDCCTPKVTANGEFLEIGCSYPIIASFLKEVKYDKISTIIDQIKGVDQKLSVNVDLAASISDIITGEEPLVSHVNSGFRAYIDF